MKNIIIAALGSYIFYGYCEVKSIIALLITFGLLWFIIEDLDESIADFKKSVRRGKRLNKVIDEVKGALK